MVGKNLKTEICSSYFWHKCDFETSWKSANLVKSGNMSIISLEYMHKSHAKLKNSGIFMT